MILNYPLAGWFKVFHWKLYHYLFLGILKKMFFIRRYLYFHGYLEKINAWHWFQGPEINFSANVSGQLQNASVQIAIFEEKHPTQLLGEIVIVNTKNLNSSSSNSTLQIKFDKKNLFYPNKKWICVYWDPNGTFQSFHFLFILSILLMNFVNSFQMEWQGYHDEIGIKI